MNEVYKDLFVGSDDDMLKIDMSKDIKNWYIIHAAKTWHKELVGYKTRSLSNTDLEYLFAIRDNELALNMVDTPSSKYFSNILFDEAFKFIDKGFAENKKVLLHCNQGESRSPSIAFLYLAHNKLLCPDFDTALIEFNNIYSTWKPKGVIAYIYNNWKDYVKI